MKKDLIIIGGGPGGYVAAIRAAQLGAKVTLIEKDSLGGTCLNRGCIPTKALFRSAQMINYIKRSDDFGIQTDGYNADINKIQDRKQGTVDKLVNGIKQLMNANGIEVIKGEGCLIGAGSVRVNTEDGDALPLESKNILIATGSVPAKPPIQGLDLPGVVTSNELLEMSEVPSSIVIIGGGVIGIEFAGILNTLGCEVTVLEFLPQIIPSVDNEVAKKLVLSLKRKGIRIETEAKVEEIISSENGLIVRAEGKKGEIKIETKMVLCSTGRSVNVEGLGLERVGVECDRRGIKVDDKFCTNIPGIYAIGDVIGGLMLAHVASDEGKAAAENIMGLTGHINYDAIPNCIFSFPEIAVVGLNEEEAKARGISCKTGKFLFGANGKALTMGEEEGFIKVLAKTDTGEIIGVHIMGPHASDLIHEAVLMVDKKLTVEAVSKTVHAHPTLSEALIEAVLGVEGRAIHSAPTRVKQGFSETSRIHT